MRPFIILRPEPAASRTAAKAAALGLAVAKIPLFELAPVDWAAPDPAGFEALVLTSANAVRHAGPGLDRLKHLPVHAVGETTAAEARAAGFTIASVGDGGVESLIVPAGKRLLHLAGRDHRAIPGAMTIVVYEARPIARPDGLGTRAGSVVAVHSPAAGRRLDELVDDQRSGIAVAAISPAAAEACGPGWQCIEAASVPTDTALLALAARLCESAAR